MSFVSFAQNYEDVMLLRALQNVKQGFYVDVGAQDPIDDSVTKAFYERGWRGINIEPVSHWFERVVTDRPHDVNLQVAVSDKPGELHLFEIVDTGLSTTDPEIARRHVEAGYPVRESDVPCITLDSILREQRIRDVHFLKVDCEGAEAAALRGISLDQVRPWIILVEATEPNSQRPAYEEWEPLLVGRGYHFVYQDGLNRFYVANEHSELDGAFQYPPNVFDRFIRASERSVRQDMDALRDRYGALLSVQRLAAAEAERDALREQVNHLHIENERREAALVQLRREITDLAAREAAIGVRIQELSRSSGAEISLLHNAVAARDQEIARLSSVADRLYRSTSWRLTAPLRWIRRIAGKGVRAGALVSRPLLRRLVSHRWLRKPFVVLVGRDSRFVLRLRQFLFGAPVAATAPDAQQANLSVPTGSLNEQASRVLAEIVDAREQHAHGPAADSSGV
ncbi:MAG TPA: FkbM family methyltransferase [Frateuria sp.]|uniref:FkbM family methyltransferase n=1 Tax=Frateuria sp. TaxID=2211372 RepID=UPI002D801811|nr:FkbM family methyltransferase [Frateuria sp.]HET6805048.1 FkbM family methyltransferase [Frateuria sp.]